MCAGVFIFVMCVTGALLSFESNILEFAESNQRVVSISAETAQLPSIDKIIAKIREVKPEVKPSGINSQNDKTKAAVVMLGRDGQIFVDPYTGLITGEDTKG